MEISVLPCSIMYQNRLYLCYLCKCFNNSVSRHSVLSQTIGAPFWRGFPIRNSYCTIWMHQFPSMGLCYTLQDLCHCLRNLWHAAARCPTVRLLDMPFQALKWWSTKHLQASKSLQNHYYEVRKMRCQKVQPRPASTFEYIHQRPFNSQTGRISAFSLSSFHLVFQLSTVNSSTILACIVCLIVNSTFLSWTVHSSKHPAENKNTMSNDL